jgi:hypothetical protein
LSDIFREVEEDVRKERLEKIWKTYGDYIIAGVVVLFAGIAGFQLWQRHEDNERVKASAALVAAQQMTNATLAADAYNTIARDAPKGYALVARLSQANAMAASGQGQNALDLYKQIATDDDGVIGSTARLRAAWLQADRATRGDLAQLLAPLNQPGNAWAPMANEVLAYADYRALDLKGALTKYRLLAADTTAPEGLRARSRAMAQFIAQGGANTFGTVPPPAPPAAPPAAAPAQAAPAK